MYWFEKATNEGVRRAYEAACLNLCEGAEDPEDRCPINPRNCVCQGIYYSRLPWWRKIFVGNRRPTQKQVLSRIADIKIKDALERPPPSILRR